MLDAPFRLDLLGRVDLRRPDGARVQSILAQPKRVALLAYVAVEADDGFAQRERVMSVLWPESDEGRARQSLRNGLYHIRQSLGADILLTEGPDGIGVAHKLVVDAVQFKRAVMDERFTDAVDLYEGEFLRGLHLSDNPEFEEWFTRKRAELQRDALQAFRETARLRQEAGDLEGAHSILRRAQEMAPADEEPATAPAPARCAEGCLHLTGYVRPCTLRAHRGRKRLLTKLGFKRLTPTSGKRSRNDTCPTRQ
jgi:DNA-binding SARP family transcriptional activator